LKGFQEGHSRILVATDIAARGIDVKDIQLVINYDLPDDPENYVHRIGRTGRAGRQGHAVAMATPDQAPEVRRIEKIMRVAIPIARHPELPLESFEHRNASAPPGKGPRRPSGGTARPQRTVRAGRWSPRNSR
jgi:ATP-dependent RNA helicase RhlE